MNCPHCGAPAVAGNNFCARCRKRIVPPTYGSTVGAPDGTASPPRPAPPSRTREEREASPPAFEAGPVAPARQRPRTVTFLAVYDLVGGALAALIGLAMIALTPQVRARGGDEVLLTGILCAAFGIPHVVAGVGLLGLRVWARPLRIVLAFVGLLGVPCGTVISVLVLIWLFKPGAALLFSGRSPEEMSPQERSQVEEASASGALTTMIAISLVATLVGGMGIVAAIVIPSFLRARSAVAAAAGEAAAFSQVQKMAAAQTAYAAANRGYHDRAECLAAPSTCIPGYAASAPAFLAGEEAAVERQGYRFTLQLGPPAPAGTEGISRTSASSFAYSAQPLNPGSRSRSFCADTNGFSCVQYGSRPIDVSAGVCPKDCGTF